MIPSAISVQAIRGFQGEHEIPLSPTLTVIYGGNGRGKTSLCEGWHWLFTGEMLEGLEPRSEVGSAARNIHVELDPRVRLIDGQGRTLAERTAQTFQNPGKLPSSTSPVLLQYRLQQVLYTSQGDRRRFFEQVLELDVESDFANKLRRACQAIDAFKHPAWQEWQSCAQAAQALGFVPPHSSPSSSAQQRANEEALLQFVSRYFGCDASPEGIERALEAGTRGIDLPVDELAPPVSDNAGSEVEAALSAIASLDAEIEAALDLSLWKERGLSFVEPPRCPFCGESSIDDSTLRSIRHDIDKAKSRQSLHKDAKSRFEIGVGAVLPLARLDIEATQKNIRLMAEKVGDLQMEETGALLSKIADLDQALGRLSETRPSPSDLQKPEVFRGFAETALEVSRVWLHTVPDLEALKERLETRRIRARYTECATSILRFHRIDREGFYRQLDAQGILAEIAKATPEVIARLRDDRLELLSEEIERFYRILRPHDPTPLEEIEVAGGVRGDIRIMAKSKDKVEHASALFSHSNANALGMATHIARVLGAGHRTVVLDDPFQSLDDSNRDQVIRDLIAELLDNSIQVVVLTHERAAAQKLLDMYADRGALGTALRWDQQEGAMPEPMYPSGDALLSIVLDGLEKDDPSEILKVASALRKLIEGFCSDYIAATGGELPAASRRNLGSYIARLEALAPGIRPSPDRVQALKDWNGKLSDEAHLAGSGASGMDELRGIAREALRAQKEVKQLRPPGQQEWKTIPRSEGLKERCKRILEGR